MSDNISRDAGKQWGAIQELRGAVREIRVWAEGVVEKIMVILTGVNGDNGLRGDLKAVAARVDQAEQEIQRVENWGRELWYEKREPACIGKRALEAFEAQHEIDHEHERAEQELQQKSIMEAIGGLNKSLAAMQGEIALAQRERQKARSLVTVSLITTAGSIIVAGLTVAIPLLLK